MIFIFGVVVSNGVKDATAEEGVEEIEINAVAQQWLWRFEYPEQAEGSFSEGIATVFSYNELVVPVDTLVHLNIDSTDVIHSWFVPALGPAGLGDAGRDRGDLVHRRRGRPLPRPLDGVLRHAAFRSCGRP